MKKPNATADRNSRLEAHRNQSQPAIGPESIGLVLTNACNLNCITCWSYSPLLASQPGIQWKRQQIDPDIVLRLIEDAAALRVHRFILTGGGDPLVYPHFDMVVRAMHLRGIKVTLISNLTLVRDPEAFLALGIETLQVNYSAADEASYLAFHPNRKPADFRQLEQLLTRLSHTPSELKLVCVVCQTNAHLLPQLIQKASHWKASIQFKLMSIAPGTEQVSVTPQQHRDLQEQLPALQELAARLAVPTNLSAFALQLQGADRFSFPIDAVGCYAGYFYARVRADASVAFCCNSTPELVVGSLREKPFSDWWFSDAWQRLRQQLHDGHYVQGCDRCGKFDLNFRLAQLEGRLTITPPETS